MVFAGVTSLRGPSGRKHRMLEFSLVILLACGLPCSQAFHTQIIHPTKILGSFPNSRFTHARQKTHSEILTKKQPATTATISRNLSLQAFLPDWAVYGLVAGGTFGLWLYLDGASDRDRKRFRREEEERLEALREERAKKAYIEPREYWKESDLAPYDGSNDEDGPILLAADGLVFNVYKGRNFYLPGCEYHIFAGRDATRLLAKNKLEEETDEEAQKPLTIAERAFLATWIYTFKGKYEIVGRLEGFDPKSTSM